MTISGAVPASFQHDPFGRRVSKTIGGMTQYLYDGANPVQEISGTTASANLLTGSVDEYFQRTDSAGARNFLTDALGTTLSLADPTGTLQTQYTFEPFGNTSQSGSTTTNSFAYTSRELDATGLYFYRARYYSASFHRFASEDPISFLGGHANLYAYGFNSPLNYTDASGQCPWCIVVLIGSGVGAVVEGYKAYEKGCRGWGLARPIGRGSLAGGLAAGVGLVTGFAAAPAIGAVFGTGAGSVIAAVGAGAVGGATSVVANEGLAAGSPKGVNGLDVA